jgi:hypothetical protein
MHPDGDATLKMLSLNTIPTKLGTKMKNAIIINLTKINANLLAKFGPKVVKL